MTPNFAVSLLTAALLSTAADDSYEDNDDSSTATSMETALASTGQATLNGLVASGTDAVMISSVDPKNSTNAFNRIAAQVPLFTTSIRRRQS